MSSSKKTLLIDADGVLLTACQSAQEVTKWGDLVESVHVDLPLAQDNVKSMLAKYEEVAGGDCEIVMCLSDPGRRYFRHDIYPEYKGNRTSNGGFRVGMGSMWHWCQDNYDTRWYPDLEGDDVLGILATEREATLDPIIVSIDKDLMQIPCKHINAGRPQDGVATVTPLEGVQFLWTQVLTGDTVDGYPGCKGIGPVRAAKVLGTDATMEESVAETYAKAGHDKAHLEAMVNCARILTWDCWQADKGVPRYWKYEGEAFND